MRSFVEALEPSLAVLGVLSRLVGTADQLLDSCTLRARIARRSGDITRATRVSAGVLVRSTIVARQELSARRTPTERIAAAAAASRRRASWRAAMAAAHLASPARCTCDGWRASAAAVDRRRNAFAALRSPLATA